MKTEKNKCIICEKLLIGRQKKYCSIKCTDKDYRDNNKGKINMRSKRYRENNKELIVKQQDKYYKNNKSKIKEYNKIYYNSNRDEISEQQKEYYNNNIEKRKKYNEKNKEEIKIKKKKYRKKNREKLKKYQDEYVEKNREKLKKYEKEYVKKNREKINKNKRKRYKKEYIFRLNCCLSSGVRQSLKFNNLNKNGRHWEDLVGYKVYELREHLEDLFKDGMSWGNHGRNGWHIDHIVPKSFFKYTSTDDVEFKYCWSLYNLQPLWEKDNISKGNKMCTW